MRQVLACNKCKKAIYFEEQEGRVVEMETMTGQLHKCKMVDNGLCPRCGHPVTFKYKKGKRMMFDVYRNFHMCNNPRYEYKHHQRGNFY